MTAPFFYGDPGALVVAQSGDELVIGGDEGRHAVTVKRLQPGESVLIGDGAGICIHGSVADTHGKDQLVVHVEQVVRQQMPTPQITVVQALIKGDRMERAVETLTEANVDDIVVWQADRSIARVNAASAEKVRAKLGLRAAQAAKQARRSWIPTVSGVLTTPELITRLSTNSRVVVLHEEAELALTDAIPVGTAAPTDVVLVVGPEGGISPRELESLVAVGAVTATMGASVMRSSTAGTVALGWVMGASGRWSVGDSGS